MQTNHDRQNTTTYGLMPPVFNSVHREHQAHVHTRSAVRPICVRDRPDQQYDIKLELMEASHRPIRIDNISGLNSIARRWLCLGSFLYTRMNGHIVFRTLRFSIDCNSIVLKFRIPSNVFEANTSIISDTQMCLLNEQKFIRPTFFLL